MRFLIALIMLACAVPAWAADLIVQVRTEAGAPVSNAVVTVFPGGRPAPITGPQRSFEIAQRDLQFSPFVLVVPVGSQVAFPNYDAVRHHVYSFSPIRRFDLRLFAREQSRSVLFDRPGFVPIGCNIHDNMIAFVAVVETALAARTDSAGRATIDNVPGGETIVRVWHPYLRAPGNQLQLRWSAPANGRQGQVVTVALRPPPRPHRAY